MKSLQIHGVNCHLRSTRSTAPRAQRCSRLRVACAAQLEKYKPPSSSTASTELEYLEQYTTVVPDTLLLQNIEEIEAPKAATVSSAVLAGILRTPGALQDYKVPRDSGSHAIQSESKRGCSMSSLAPKLYPCS